MIMFKKGINKVTFCRKQMLSIMNEYFHNNLVEDEGFEVIGLDFVDGEFVITINGILEETIKSENEEMENVEEKKEKEN
jgi:hypothetical protein